jgi:hypothetical protein
MAMQTQPNPQSSPLQSVQDLYDMINGKVTTQSGGTTTKTESGSFSQDSMNQMLKSALEGTNGLAAVAGGQRAAGGYGSSTNQLLVNDLLTRSAGQIAQLNTSKTTQTSTPQSSTTVGGATLTGGAKTAGFLGALKALGELGVFKKSKTESTDPNSIPTDQSAGAASYFNPANVSNTASGTDGNPSLYSVDLSNSVPVDSGISAQADQTQSLDAASSDAFAMPDIGIDMSTVTDSPAMSEDPLAFLNDLPPPDGFADGGLVKNDMANAAMTDSGGDKSGKKSLGSMLGTQSNVVIDPRTGLVGGASSYNAEAVAAAQSLNGSGTSVGSNFNSGSAYGFGSGDSSGGSSGSGSSGGGSLSRGNISGISGLTSSLGSLVGSPEMSKLGAIGSFASSPGLSDAAGIAGRAMSGDTTRADVSNVSSSLGSLANALGDKNLGAVATVGKIASAPSLSSAAMGIANVATEGLAGKVKNLADSIANPSLTSTIDAVAAFNPLSAAYNAVANFADVATLGQIATNANAMMNPNQMMNPDLQAIANESPIAQAVDRMNQNGAFGDSEASRMASGGSTGDPDANAAGDTAAGGYTGGGSGGGLGGGGKTGGTGEGSNGNAGNGRDADGGLKQGPGNGVSDSIPTNVSNGEFIISADVVKAVGLEKLQAMQDKYHVPAAVQKLQKFARG